MRFRITVDAEGTFTSADQVTAVATAPQESAGQSVAFEVYQGNLVGWWGPASGFPLPKGYQAQTTFDVTVKAGAPTGTYNVTVELVDLANNAVLASTSGQVTVAAPPQVTFKNAPSQSWVNAAGGRITALVPPQFDRKSLVPVFYIAEGAKLRYGGTEYEPDQYGRVIIEEGVDLSQPQTFTVIAPDGTSRDWRVTVLSLWMHVSPKWVVASAQFERTFTLTLEGDGVTFKPDVGKDDIDAGAWEHSDLSVTEVTYISATEIKVRLSGSLRHSAQYVGSREPYSEPLAISVRASGLAIKGDVWLPQISWDTHVYPALPLFGLDGTLDRQDGITARLTVTPDCWLWGPAAVVFQLMKGNEQPVSIVALEKENWYKGQQETFFAHFNVTGQEYTVKVFVLDEFTSNPEYAPISVAAPLTLQ